MKSSGIRLTQLNQHHQSSNGDHLVHFFDKTDSLVQVFCNYAIPGINRGEAVVVVATKQHQKAFLEGLQIRSIDINRVISRGQFILLDAHETLSQIISKNKVDEEKFFSLINNLNQTLKQKFTSIRAYGEMVNLLCSEGNYQEALKLEGLWHQFIRTEPVTLFCGYSSDVIHESEISFHQVCSLHSHVLVSDGFIKVR